MGVMSYIQAKKQAFKNQMTASQVERINKETERLKMEQKRQGEIARANAERAKVSRDVDNIEKFNRKYPTPPSNVQRFGRGLAKVINKGQNDIAELKKQGGLKGIDFGGTSQKSGGVFDKGKAGPFSLSPDSATKPQKIQQKKKVVTTFY